VRANTTDLTSNVYNNQRLDVSNTAVTALRFTATSSRIGTTGQSGEKSSIVLEIQNPQTAVQKTLISQNCFFASGTGIIMSEYVTAISSTVAHNGFSLLAGGNFSANISIYGYAKV
jgi:hypothetical protein